MKIYEIIYIVRSFLEDYIFEVEILGHKKEILNF
jgi:hypothetical protein